MYRIDQISKIDFFLVKLKTNKKIFFEDNKRNAFDTFHALISYHASSWIALNIFEMLRWLLTWTQQHLDIPNLTKPSRRRSDIK